MVRYEQRVEHVTLSEKQGHRFSRRGVFKAVRKVAVYLTRRLRGDKLKQIAAQFQIGKWCSVSRVIEKMML